MLNIGESTPGEKSGVIYVSRGDQPASESRAERVLRLKERAGLLHCS